jgi:hypothetical protein
MQAANERLEQALVESTRSSAAAAAGGAAAEPSCAAESEADAVGEATAKLAVASGRLQAAEERVEQLEELLKVRLPACTALRGCLHCVAACTAWLLS